MIGKLGLLLVGAWFGRWVLFRFASYAGRHRLPYRHPDDSPRRPGHMPGPFD